MSGQLRRWVDAVQCSGSPEVRDYRAGQGREGMAMGITWKVDCNCFLF